MAVAISSRIERAMKRHHEIETSQLP
jgi:hypothetical protein